MSTNNSTFTVEVVQKENDSRDVYQQIVDKYNEHYFKLKAKNPQGYIDSFECQLDRISLEIADEIEAKLTLTENGYRFDVTGLSYVGKSL